MNKQWHFHGGALCQTQAALDRTFCLEISRVLYGGASFVQCLVISQITIVLFQTICQWLRKKTEQSGAFD